MRFHASLLALLAAAPLAGCDRAPADPDAIVRTLAASDMMPGLDPLGVAFDDENQTLLVLASDMHVYAYDADGAALAQYDLSSIGTLSAIAAVPGTRDVLVTDPRVVQGYRVDLDTLAVRTTFCLLPDEQPLVNQEMRSFGLGYDPATDRIVVAPYWWDLDADRMASASLETYDGTTGALVSWQDLGAAGITAEALDVDPATGAVSLVDDGVLYAWHPSADPYGLGGTAEPVRDLGRDLGIRDMLSFAPDRVSGDHWLLDVRAAEFVEAR